MCGTPIPDWRHKLRASWTTPWDLDLSLTWRYIAAVDDDRTSSDPNLTSDVIPTDKHLGARSYFDLTGSYSFSEVGVFKQPDGRLGINNLLDKDPPLVGQDTLPGRVLQRQHVPAGVRHAGPLCLPGLTADF